MSNEIDVMKDFKTKLSDKIRTDIGSLLPESAISKLIEDCIEKEFFEPVVSKDGWNSKVEASWFVKEVKAAIKPIIEQSVKEYVDTHQAEIKTAVDEYVKQENLTLLATAAMTYQLQTNLNNQMYSMVDMIATRLKQNY